MEDLFSTKLAVNNEHVNYRVIFDNERYVFLADAGDKALSTFSFKREHDQWLDEELVPSDIRKQALDALERYLMRQH